MEKVPETYLNSDFNEDDFDDYNPYPYKGGYDIVLAYGLPLAPSPAICYPIGGGGGDGGGLGSATVSGNNSDTKTTDSPTATEGRDYVPGNWNPEWNHCGRCRDGGSSRNVIQWAADFLFGYLAEYGEKRDETHNYGNLNYAYDRHTFQQPLTQMVETCVDQQLSFNSNRYQHDNNSSFTVQVEPPWTWQGELTSYEGGGGGGDYPLMDDDVQNSYQPEPAWYDNIGDYDYGEEVSIDVDSSLFSYAAKYDDQPAWSSPDVDFPYYEDYQHRQPLSYDSYPESSSQYVVNSLFFFFFLRYYPILENHLLTN